MNSKETTNRQDFRLDLIRSYVMLLGNLKKSWLIDNHLLHVESHAKRLINLYQPQSPNVIIIAAWLHDIGKLTNNYDDHEIYAANFVAKNLPRLKYSSPLVDHVAHICLYHDQEEDPNPTLESNILRTADALAHFTVDDFYYKIFESWLNEAKANNKPNDFPREAVASQMIAKLNRDYHHKIAFDSERESVQQTFEYLKKYFLTNK